MSVFVDQLCDYGWSFGKSCHLYADSAEELHEFAAGIGLKRAWFQNKPNFPHYDLTESMRKKAVAHGAIEETRREFAANQRGKRVLGS